MCVLGRALMRRRHRVAIISYLDAEEKIRNSGLEFIPISERDFPRGEWDRLTGEQAQLTGLRASRFVGKWLANVSRGIVRDLPGIIERERFDGLVMDQISIGAEAVCQVTNTPLAVACNALAMNPDWTVPPANSHQ